MIILTNIFQNYSSYFKSDPRQTDMASPRGATAPKNADRPTDMASPRGATAPKKLLLYKMLKHRTHKTVMKNGSEN